jgi:hypothetical protein
MSHEQFTVKKSLESNGCPHCVAKLLHLPQPQPAVQPRQWRGQTRRHPQWTDPTQRYERTRTSFVTSELSGEGRLRVARFEIVVLEWLSTRLLWFFSIKLFTEVYFQTTTFQLLHFSIEPRCHICAYRDRVYIYRNKCSCIFQCV